MVLSQVIGRIAEKLALLRVFRQGEEEFLGTGYAVTGSGHVLTCRHQVEGALRVIVQFVGRSAIEARILACREADDLALLHVDAEHPSRGVDLDTADAPVGSDVGFMGFPFSALFDPPLAMTMRGIIGNRYGSLYVVDAMLSEGMSGSPLFLTGTGRVIGTMSARFDPARTRARMRGLDDLALPQPSQERTTISFAIPSLPAHHLLSASRA